MASKLCCRTCQHCTGSTALSRWCRLRQLDVHAEVADVVVCHHWTARSPQLPSLPDQSGPHLDRQLELDRAFA
ncbi:MAG: hypothetical protein CL862_13970 [Cyanobium sp. NAT70]|nr:hypothetical protein [Cyanobium sp. NAT70]